jgi:3-hydroxybutyryl-CoA dehydrogenase
VSIVGVAGAGFMGSGIAQTAAAAGKRVLVYEPDQEPLDHSADALAQALEKAVTRGRLDQAQAAATAGRISYTTRIEDLAQASVLLEAVVEDLAVKRELFARLDEAAPDAAFLASNTSSIPIGALAAATTRPERVLGVHFFSPVPVMKLVEIVVALETAPGPLAAAEAFAAELGKQPIRSGDRAGFVVNMLLVPYLMAAVRMYEQGFASREDIDAGMTLGCGHPMGPLTLCDFIGLDVLAAICDSLYQEYRQADYAPPPLLARMVAAGRLGRKSGRGFYDYSGQASA